MNREILFRGKAINRNENMEYRTNYKNGDWVYGLISKPYCERFPDLPAEMTNTNGISGIEVDYTTIGQYTSLTDRNGVKIFEGDILIGYFRTNHSKQKFCVSFDDGMFLFDNHHVRVSKYDIYSMKVIGNIHDNPELMKGEGNV